MAGDGPLYLVKIVPIRTRTRNFHSRVRLFAGLSIPVRDIDFMSCSVFICALRSHDSALKIQFHSITEVGILGIYTFSYITRTSQGRNQLGGRPPPPQ